VNGASTPGTPGPRANSELPRLARVLAVCAHPDDESFGLGVILAALAGAGTSSSMLCFTHGEASTLGPGPAGLRRIRAGELAAAAAVLGIAVTTLLAYPDGGQHPGHHARRARASARSAGPPGRAAGLRRRRHHRSS